MTTVVILAAGQGKRMKSAYPKILHCIGGKALIHHVIDTAATLNPTKTIVVISPYLKTEQIKQDRMVDFVVQEKALGTGNAMQCALPLIDQGEDILILCGDVPLIEPDLLEAMRLTKHSFPQDIVAVGFHSQDPAYGRMVSSQGNFIDKIVEYKDASPEEQNITLCNSAIYLISYSVLAAALPNITSANQAEEFYLTDIINLAAQEGIKTRVIEWPMDSLLGVNDRAQLAKAESLLQTRWRTRWMLSGVTLVDPSSVFFSYDTDLGKDVVIHPNVQFGLGVKIEEDVTIYPNCYLSQTTIKTKAKVGPFAHLRAGTIVGEGAEIGNFVETKNAVFEPLSKAKHLSYIGDAHIGASANIGAGTITCNYNGFKKSKTTVGAKAFVGSNSCLIAPVTIGEECIVAAGSVIGGNVPDHSLALTRAEKIIKLGGAKKFKEKWS